MIRVDITTRNFEADSRLGEYITDKLQALDKFVPRQVRDTAQAQVVLEDDPSGREDNRFVAEVIMNISGETFVAKEGTINMYAAFDIVEAKLKAQLRTYKDKSTREPRRARMLGGLIGRTAESESTGVSETQV